MFYLDTSFVIASLTEDEAQSEGCRKWLENAAVGSLSISHWVGTELWSALSVKVRMKQLGLDHRAEILLRWRILESESLSTLAVRQEDFELAARFAGQPELSLRAGDALHIAIAKSAGLKLVTLDKRMSAAALELGVPVAAVSHD